MKIKTTPVLISGAGPVGLTLGLLLAQQGIKNIIVEKHPGISIHPKARGVNARSMEIFRSLGIEDNIRAHELSKGARRFLWAESVSGKAVAEVKLDDMLEEYSPCQPCFVTQDLVEQELLKKCQNEPNCEVLFKHKLVDFSDNKNQINCQVENLDDNSKLIINADYLISAEGAHSQIREKLGITMQGIAEMGSNFSVYAEFPEKPPIAGKEAIVMVLIGEQYRSRFVMAVDLDKRWMVMIPEALIDESEQDENYPTKLCQYVMQTDMPVTVHSTSTWEMAALNAEKYQKGNIFLVGDAAHRIPPTGGMGMNTGLQDAHNLAWKLSAVILDKADASLLETYESERKPIAQITIDWSVDNATRIREIFAAIENYDDKSFADLVKLQKQQLDHPGLDFGCNYIDQSDFSTEFYEPKFKIGMRIPHFILKQNGVLISSLDLIKNDYILFTTREDSCFDFDGDCKKILLSKNDIIFNKYVFDDIAAVLVRPDGVVEKICY